MTTPVEQTLEAKLGLLKYPKDTKLSYKLDQTVPWVAELLREMNETATDKTPGEWLLETNLAIQLDLTKKYKNEEGEYLLAAGSFQCTYATEDVRTLDSMKVSMEVSFKAIFLAEPVTKTDAFAEINETWMDGDTYEIYPYVKGTVDIGEMLHEQLFLHRIPYPMMNTSEEGTEELDGGLETDKPRQ